MQGQRSRPERLLLCLLGGGRAAKLRALLGPSGSATRHCRQRAPPAEGSGGEAHHAGAPGTWCLGCGPRPSRAHKPSGAGWQPSPDGAPGLGGRLPITSPLRRAPHCKSRSPGPSPADPGDGRTDRAEGTGLGGEAWDGTPGNAARGAEKAAGGKVENTDVLTELKPEAGGRASGKRTRRTASTQRGGTGCGRRGQGWRPRVRPSRVSARCFPYAGSGGA